MKPSRSERLLLSLVRRTAVGSLDLALPDGTRDHVVGAEPGPVAALAVHDPRFAGALLRDGTCGLGEAYMRGWFSTDDLPSLVEFGARNRAALEAAIEGNRFARTMRSLWYLLARANSRRGSRRNIAAHYDLGNAFYERWLDPTMTYSSAVFTDAAQPLEHAQEEKWRRIAAAARIAPGHRVLEIGCGWGGFATFVARDIGAHVTAVTVSPAQHDYAQRRVQAEGLADRVTIRLQDYRDVEAGGFDRVASIEMFEAVGERYWPVFFDKLRDVMKPDGVAALQVITIADQIFTTYRRSADFIQKYIFPGGMLPSPSILKYRARSAGFDWVSEANFGADYARTLAEWRRRFLAAWDEIHPLGFDERFRRMWEFYLAYCEGGFRAGSIDVMQLSLVRR